jgi:hypothetical protein
LCGQSFIFSQEVACHVRDKKCQFYNLNKSIGNVESATSKSTTATITSATDTNSFGQSSSVLIVTDSITDEKCEVDTNRELGATSSASGSMYPTLDMSLIDSNFTYILSGSVMAPPTPLTNENTFFQTNPAAKSDNDDISSALQNQDNAEIKFKCKLCSFR